GRRSSKSALISTLNPNPTAVLNWWLELVDYGCQLLKNYNMKNKLTMLAVAAVVAASVCVSKAQPYYVVGNYNGWNNPSATAMTDVGPVTGGEEYSYQVTGQPANTFPADGFKVTDGTWNNTWPSANLKFEYDAS